MDIKHVAGKSKGDVFLYALSTCGWCKKTKAYLNESSVEYSYVDVDLVPEAEQDKVTQEVMKWNPQCSFPTVVINKSTCIVGYQPDKIKEVLGL
jgi:glutaredoxin